MLLQIMESSAKLGMALGAELDRQWPFGLEGLVVNLEAMAIKLPSKQLPGNLKRLTSVARRYCIVEANMQFKMLQFSMINTCCGISCESSGRRGSLSGAQ